MNEDPEKQPTMSRVLEMMSQYKANADTGMSCLRYSALFVCISWSIFLADFPRLVHRKLVHELDIGCIPYRTNMFDGSRYQSFYVIPANVTILYM